MRLNTLAVAIATLVILVAQYLAPESYVWTEHTISHLGAQGYERAYIMRVGLGALGALIALGAYRRARIRSGPLLLQVPLALYGGGILVSAFFSAPPFIEGVAYSAAEASAHSIAATVAGAGISIAALGYGFFDPYPLRRVVHFACFTGLIGLSALFGAIDSSQGLVQRSLWAVGFAWLIFIESAWRARPSERMDS